MKSSEWPKEDVKKAAEGTGKPAEVACAQAFLNAGWKARLGSYFADGALDVPRELDVLAVKETNLPGPWAPVVRVRVLVSCRGFPLDRAPLTYSVSTDCIPTFDPRLFSSHRGSRARMAGTTNIGSLSDLELTGGERLLDAVGLRGRRPIVALDVIERVETPPPKRDPARGGSVECRRVKDGDARLFSAFDSALKAGFYWMQEDYQSEGGNFATLHVPVCVLSVPFWDICIDPGVSAEPELCHRGYQIGQYPHRPQAREVITLVWSAEELPILVAALDDLFEWFVQTVKEDQSGAWPMSESS